MSSSAHGSEDSAGRPYAESERAVPALDGKPEGDLFEQVLQETLSLAGQDTPLKPEEMELLFNVARRYGGQPLAAEPMVELVESVLRMRFGSLSGTKPLWSTMSREIARILLDDPQTCQRLEAFWARLCEAAQ